MSTLLAWIGLAWMGLVWAGSASAQDTYFDSPDSATVDAESDEDSYVADPSESFVVEHSGAIAPTAPRVPFAAADRCREYQTDADGPYGRGLACPQPDGSWRIVSGPEEMTASLREREERARAYPDYADGAEAFVPPRASRRRFRLDWNTWASERDARRGNAYRPYGNRYDE